MLFFRLSLFLTAFLGLGADASVSSVDHLAKRSSPSLDQAFLATADADGRSAAIDDDAPTDGATVPGAAPAPGAPTVKILAVLDHSFEDVEVSLLSQRVQRLCELNLGGDCEFDFRAPIGSGSNYERVEGSDGVTGGPLFWVTGFKGARMAVSSLEALDSDAALAQYAALLTIGGPLG